MNGKRDAYISKIQPPYRRSYLLNLKATRWWLTVVLVGLHFLWPSGLIAQSLDQKLDENHPYMHLGNRYTYENQNNYIPAHWGGKIFAQFVGLTETEVQENALLNFLLFSDAGDYEAVIQGFPADTFAQSNVSNDTNFLLIEFSREDLKKISVGKLDPDLHAALTNISNGYLSEIIERGVTPFSEGCSARWSATPENVINAYIIAMSSDLSQDEKISCLKETMPRGFGIFSFATKYSIPLADTQTGRKYEVSFSDRSELLLEMAASAACRKQLPLSKNSCPFYVINEVLRYHGDLVEQFGSND